MSRNPSRPVVVVTGASAGLGRAIAHAWAKRRARVGLLARDPDALEAARREVMDLGGDAIAIVTDMSDPDQVDGAATRVEHALGPIDIWVNNAMVSVFSPVAETTAEEYRRVSEVLYLGYVHGTLAALRRMRPRDHGVLVQIGSALAYRGIPLQSAYCAAKHAIQGFTESLRAELLHEASGIRVVSVHMPALNTPQFRWVRSRLPRKPQPVPPIYQPELGAEAVVLAVEQGRAEVWFGYPTVLAIIANRLAPRLVDRYLARTGYEAQQTSEPVEPGRRDNLYEPVSGAHATHGDFDARASGWSTQLWLARHRGWLVAGAAVAIVGALGLNRRTEPPARRAA
jgi:NAD(P)-dependent dehydrogenase (short-subunit alcohol dehydrogenase family)